MRGLLGLLPLLVARPLHAGTLEAEWRRAAAAFDGLGAAPPAVAPAPAGLEERHVRLLEALLSADAITANDGAPWPGYRLLAQPVMIYRRDGLTILVNHPSPPEGFEAFLDPRLPPGGPPVHVRRRQMEGVPTMAFGFPIGGQRVFAYAEADGPSSSPFRIVRFIAHERLHVEQRRWKRLPLQASPYPLDDPENLALAGLEQLLLHAALGAQGRAEFEDRLKDFVAVRAFRRGRAAGDLARHEDWKEQNEGTARYLDTRVAAALRREHPGLDPAFGEDELQLDRFPGVEGLEHSRYYATGAAIGLALDRAGTDWKPRVEAGEALSAILSGAFPSSPDEAPARVDAAKAAFRYAELQAKAGAVVQAWVAERDAVLARLELGRREGFAIDVKLQGRPGRPLAGSSQEQGRGYTLGRKKLLDGTAVYTSGALYAELSTRVVLVDGLDFQTYADEPPLVLVDGAPVPAGAGRVEFGSLLVEAFGLRIKVTEPGVLLLRDAGLTVEYAPGAPDAGLGMRARLALADASTW